MVCINLIMSLFPNHNLYPLRLLHISLSMLLLTFGIKDLAILHITLCILFYPIITFHFTKIPPTFLFVNHAKKLSFINYHMKSQLINFIHLWSWYILMFGVQPFFHLGLALDIMFASLVLILNTLVVIC